MNAQAADIQHGLQILRDVQRRQPRDWLSIDDDVIGWEGGYMHKVVQSDPYEGISAPAMCGAERLELR